MIWKKYTGENILNGSPGQACTSCLLTRLPCQNRSNDKRIQVFCFETPHTSIFKCPLCGNPRYGYYFGDYNFHKMLEIYQRAARVQFLRKLLKLLQNEQQQQKQIVALFLYLMWCKNMQIVKEK